MAKAELDRGSLEVQAKVLSHCITHNADALGWQERGKGDPTAPGAKRDLSPPRVLGPASPPGCRNGAPSPVRPGAARDASAGLAAAATLRAPAEGRGLGGGGEGGGEGGGSGSGSGGPGGGQSQEARRRRRNGRRTRSMRGAAGLPAVKPAAPRAQGVAVASCAHRD